MSLLRVASAMSLCAVAFSVQAEQLPIEVLSAVVKDQKIADAEVLLQRNGAQNVVGRTNAQGQVTLTSEAADDASNLLIIKKPGYSNLVVKCPCKGMTYAISPVMENLDGLRVVLTWGQTPDDLDSHMIFPGNNIYFENKTGTDAELDVDDTDSYGPETITLQKNTTAKATFTPCMTTATAAIQARASCPTAKPRCSCTWANRWCAPTTYRKTAAVTCGQCFA